jgi:hypothetical protein
MNHGGHGEIQGAVDVNLFYVHFPVLPVFPVVHCIFSE